MASKKKQVAPARTYTLDDLIAQGIRYIPEDQPVADEVPQEPTSRSWGSVAQDVGISALKGAIGVPEAAVGLADMATGGYAGQLAEQAGFRPKEAKAMLDEGYSSQQQAAFQKVQAAQGLGDTFMSAVQNPSVVGHSVIESLPLMGAGGVLARGGLALAPKLGAVAAGAVGEGAVGAGSAAEQIRQQGTDGLLTAEQTALAGATGVLTTGFSMLGGKIAQKLGIADVDTMLAGAATNPAVSKGVVRSALEGALSEGVLEELPQSVAEQVLQNQALGKPLDEGVNQAAVLGLLSGGTMGAGANMLSSFGAKPEQASGLPQPAPATPPLQLGNTPDPLIGFPDGTVARRSEADAYINSLPPEQQPAARAKIMGLAPQPAKPAGALTRAANVASVGLPGATAVQEIQHAQASEADQAAYDQATDAQEQEATQQAQQQAAEQDTTNQPITHGKIAEAALSPEDKQAVMFSNQAVADGGQQWTGTQDGDILNGMGAPFKTKFAAVRRAQMEGKDWTIATVFDGFVARRGDARNGATAETASLDQPAATGTSDRPAGGGPAAVGAVPTGSGTAGNTGGSAGATESGNAVVDGGTGAHAVGPTGNITTAIPDAGIPTTGTAPENSAQAATENVAQQPVTQPAQPGTTGEGAGGSQPTQVAATKPKTASKADLDHLFGIDQKRKAALGRIAKGTAYFSTGIRAQQFITQSGLKDTHTVQRHASGANRFDVVTKPADQKTSQPQGSTNGTQAAKTIEATQEGQEAPAAAVAPEAPFTPVGTGNEGKQGLVLPDGWSVAPMLGGKYMPMDYSSGSQKRPIRREFATREEAAKAARDHVSAKKPVTPQLPPAAPVRNMQTANATATPAQATLNRILDLNDTPRFNDLDAATHDVDVGYLKKLHDQVRGIDAKTEQESIKRKDRIGYLLAAIGSKESGKGGLGSKKQTEKPMIVTDKAEMRPYRKPDGSVGYEAVPIQAETPADGQQDELDAETRSYEAKANPTYSGEPAKSPEAPAKTDALKEQEKAAKAKMLGAAAKLAALLSKNTRMNITPEQEQAMLPIVIELFEGAMDLGYVKFKQAARYVREFLANAIDQDAADSIPIDTLQGAYIATARRHSDKDITPKKDVIAVDTLADLQEEVVNPAENADTDAAPQPVTDEPKESLLGANDDTRRNAANDSEPLDETLSGGLTGDGQGGNAETGAGLRPADAQGNGRPEGGRTGRGNSLDGSKKPVLPGTPAEIRPLADGPVGKTEDRPQQLSGENPGNFAITDEFKLGQGTDGDKISGNLAAIRTLRLVQSENRYPTKDEQTIMARYVGWGGLKTVFDPKKENATDQFGKAQRELKTLLSADEYRAANGSIRNAHYTAEGIVDGMWRVIRFMGFKGGRSLEPTVGIGNFIGRMPADMAASTEWHASELDTTTGQLAAMLYPEANILASTGFQDAPFADGAFDISVGNPPFGSQTITDKSPNRKHLNGQKIHNYIIAKAGMHLRPGGVMSMVVTHRFLDTANPEARDVLAKDFRFLGAFRLPNDAFKKNAGTDVVTDVVFLQKLGADEKRERDASWLDVNGSIDMDGQAIRVNRYYQDNPAHILGRSALDGKMQRTGEAEYTVHSDGRDIGKAIDALMQGGFSHMAGVLDQSNNSKALAPAMLTQSNLPIGGVMVNDEGQIIRRELNDAQGNAVVQEITADTLWKDQALEWQALQGAVLDVKKAAQEGNVTADDANEVLALSRFLFKSDGAQQAKPTKAVEAVYKLVEDLAKPATFKWSHNETLLLITGALNRKQLGEDGYQALKGMLDLRNRTLRLIMAEQSGDAQMETYRGDLNRAYDAFVKANGFLSDPKNANLLEGDVGAEAGIEANFVPAISAAVAKSSGTPQRTASAMKSDIMSQRVNFPYKEISHADSPADALFASISEHGKVDLPYMAKITNQSVQSVIESLSKGDNPQLFRDPETGEYQEAERYLSGNVKHKLQQAIEHGLESNIKALEKSLPADKSKEQVKPNIRGIWMPPEIFTEFLEAVGYTDARLTVIPSQGILQANGDKLAMTDFGIQFKHGKRTPLDMFNSQASGKPIIISVTSNGKTYKDEQGTKEVNALAERMGKVFQEWAYADDNRVSRIVAAFNQNMNTHTPRTFDGVKYLKPVGASPSIVMRKTQMDGAWRMMQERTMLADHVVGAGKTYTLITGIMERRRMGLSRKPMVVVPNHLVTQWARDFYKLYPGAKVLAASPADFAKKNRRRLLARIATGDYDAVIVGHTSIGFMETPAEDLKAIVDEKLAGLKEALAEARKNNESKRTLGQIEDRIDRYEERLKDLAARPVDEIGIDFKALGIDHLSVDEAHEFKNLEYSTSGDRVVGMNDPNGSKKAFDLYSKVRGLLSRGGGVTFATGTPVSNSLVEIYTMMSYLAHDELVLRGQEHFDSWSGAYAATETRLEYTATQKLKPRRVLAGLNNLSALRQLYEQFADIITMSDLKRIYTEEMEQKNKRDGTSHRTDFPIPKVMGERRQLVSGDITPAQKEYMDYLVARMAQIERNKSDKEYLRIDNALNVLTDARKMSLDIRIVDPTAQRDENGKVATAAKNIKATYDKWDADRGTQLVFCDLSTPAKTAAKEARSIIAATVEKLFGKDLAKQAKQQLAGMTFEKQWALLVEKAEEIADNAATSEEKRDAIAEYMSKIEDPEATMNVADIGFSVYDDMRTVLMESGIPESEIAFIHDYNTPEQKDKLFDRVNNGYVRVLIGSSMKMGAGMNVQERLVALHHMDAPWRPSDVEQREGRIIRQKNSLYLRDPDGFEVDIKAYSTNQTSDTVMWQILERKAGAIEQFRNGGLDTVEEEGGDSNQYAEFMATSTGNPVFRQKLEAERKLTEIESEIGGALIVRSNANSFLEAFDRRSNAAQSKLDAAKAFDASTASFGGESGTQAEYEAAMKVANDEYLAKYAVWTQKNADADLAIAKWEVLPEATRGDKPSKPTMPSQPDLFTKSVQKASGYARAIGMALNEAAVGKTVKITMNAGSVLVDGQDFKGSPYWTAIAQNNGEKFVLDSSGAQKANASSRIIRALTPFAMSNKMESEAKGYGYEVAQLNSDKTLATKNAKIAVSTTERDTARAELNWLTAQVAFAEVEADIARGASKNRYIERDKRRNISQTQAVATEEPKHHVVDGVGYTTTGLKATSNYQGVTQATRDSDGMPAILTKTNTEGVFQAALQPESLRKAKPADVSTNPRYTGAPESNTTDVVFSRSATPSAGLPPAQVQAIVNTVAARWKNAPEIIVATSMSDKAIPQKVRDYDQTQKSQGATGEPEGFVYGGKVYMVGDQLATPADVMRVLLHESLGHMGLRGVFGDTLKPILKQIAVMRAGDVRAKAAQYGIDMNTESGRLEAAEEVLAEMAQSRPELGYVKRAIAAIRNWLRSHGFAKLAMTDADIIQGIILPARRHIEGGASSGNSSTQPAFSRAAVASYTQHATDKLNETFSHPGKLNWWHKSFGTMNNLAERSPEFKPVFQAAQGFIDDTSYYATEAADMAPSILPKLENWADLAKSPITAADNKAVSAPIFEGTLSWARDESGKPVRLDEGSEETAGIVWTDAELKSQFNLTPEQIKLYREFRSTVDKSLDNLAKADLLRFGGKSIAMLQDQVMDAKDADEAAVLLRDYLHSLRDLMPERADELTATASGMMDRADKVNKLKKQGYAPLSRFGKYTVDVVVNGERQYFSLFETERESNKMAAKMRMAYGAAAVGQGTLSESEFKLFAGVTPESLELFGNMLGLDSTGDAESDKAFQTYLKLTKTNRSAMRRMIHRKGIAGFSEDAGRVLASFVYSNARQTSAALHMGTLGEAVNNIPKNQGELKDAAIALADYIKNPQEEAQAVRGLLFAQYLGGSISSAFVNMTQPFAVTFPWLSQYGGAKQSGAQLLRAMKDMAAKDTVWAPDLAKALKHAEENGIVSPQEVHQLMAQARGAGTLKSGDGTKMGDALATTSNVISKLSLGWGKVFGMAEQLNRRSTFIAAYRVAQAQNMKDPATFAERAVNETQFMYSKANKMKFGRGAMGGTLMTFKTYTIAYLELLSRMATQGGPEGKKAVVLALAVMMLMGGSGGLPFMEDATDLVDGLLQRLGYNVSTKKAKQQFLEDLFGKTGADFIDRGVSGLPGMPLDVTGRLGMGNVIPGTGLFQSKSSHASDLGELVGPAGDMFKRAFDASGKLLGGDIGGAALAISPVAVRNAAKGADMASTGMYRDAKGYKVLDTTMLEAALKSVGFQPETVANIQEANYINQKAKNFYTQTASEIRAKWAKGIFEKDQDQINAAREHMVDWNTKNPDQRISANMGSILKRVHEMRKTKDQRIAATAPRAMRAAMRRDLAAEQ